VADNTVANHPVIDELIVFCICWTSDNTWLMLSCLLNHLLTDRQTGPLSFIHCLPSIGLHGSLKSFLMYYIVEKQTVICWFSWKLVSM